MSEIKALVEKENIFSAATPLRGKQIYSAVSIRASSLSDDYMTLFTESNLETQKLINLMSIMNTDTLFFEFMYEVYREKLIIGDKILSDADIRVFFLNKRRESEKVAAWTDQTFIRLLGSYKTYLAEAGLLERGRGDRKIVKPYIDGKLSALLSDNDTGPILKILTGKR
jgi:alpha-mannosidase